MAGKGGHAKGADYERFCCKKLSIWVTNGRRLDVFWRSAMSGGRLLSGHNRGEGRVLTAHAGDVSATSPEGALLLRLFLIDAKHYKDLEADRPIFGYQGAMSAEWSKLKRDVELAARNDGIKREPLGLFKQSHRGEVLLTTRLGRLILQTGSDARLVPRATFPSLGLLVFDQGEIFGQVDFDRIREEYSE